ncbi:hypothetical protein C8Q69DRAFT_121595 [Paecilomyces variotii]|uniref:Uncharacterized protein n=1 Tax=Byssochlamys spectabilis TaxID=264951 RepID=A0A443HJ08_BYSSP|nr:hypothetical protein C8Q69DRAFT_121595 [Paecilomyces variotii]RWQ91759.1 hypothetical protein C8Q69DRAFT_121595 [Paecilomyces variotii]
MEWKWNEILAFFFFLFRTFIRNFYLTPLSSRPHIIPFFYSTSTPVCVYVYILFYIPLFFLQEQEQACFLLFCVLFFFLYLILTCSLGAWPEPYLPNDSMVSFFSFFFFLYI